MALESALAGSFANNYDRRPNLCKRTSGISAADAMSIGPLQISVDSY